MTIITEPHEISSIAQEDRDSQKAVSPELLSQLEQRLSHIFAENGGAEMWKTVLDEILSLKFSAEVCDKMGLEEGDPIRNVLVPEGRNTGRIFLEVTRGNVEEGEHLLATALDIYKHRAQSEDPQMVPLTLESTINAACRIPRNGYLSDASAGEIHQGDAWIREDLFALAARQEGYSLTEQGNDYFVEMPGGKRVFVKRGDSLDNTLERIGQIILEELGGIDQRVCSPIELAYAMIMLEGEN